MLKENDFIEIEFTGKVKDGEVFDSNVKEELEKLHAGHDHEIKAKPFVFCLGQEMFLKGIDEFLIGKEAGKKYEVELTPEKAFGQRNRELIKTIPMRVFKEKKINPVPGAMFNFDGRIGKILTVSGGRVIVDFNHALAGKDVIYDVKVLRKIEDINEKVSALNDFFFRKDFNFEADVPKGKLVLQVEKPFVRYAEMFKDKFKEILGLELEIKEVEEAKPEKTEEKKQEGKENGEGK